MGKKKLNDVEISRPDGEDCPAELIDLFESSTSSWRKGVIKEFIAISRFRALVSQKLSRMEKEQVAIIALLVGIALYVLKEVISQILSAI